MAIIIRVLTRADVPEARRIFALGMMQTITAGARTGKLACVAFALAALAAAGARALAGRVGIESPRPAAVVCAVAAFSLAFFGWPRHIAHAYVSKSLGDDMKDPVARYVESLHAGNFWVAYDTDEERVVGTVALEPPDPSGGTKSMSAKSMSAKHQGGDDPHSPWNAGAGDGELRRMSVVPSHRGKGISKRLFGALWKHARESKKFSRVVLSTSEMQASACQLYPNLGFQVVKEIQLPHTLLPLIKVFYFSKAM
jgi:GNAT superfamily N-acetyltransferase